MGVMEEGIASRRPTYEDQPASQDHVTMESSAEDAPSRRGLVAELSQIWVNSRAKHSVALATLVFGLTGVVTSMGIKAGSLAIGAYMVISWVDGVCLLAEFVPLWAANQKPCYRNPFGCAQVEVMVAFSCGALCLLALFGIAVEAGEHLWVSDGHRTDGGDVSFPLLVVALATRLCSLSLATRNSYVYRHLPDSGVGRVKHWLADLVQSFIGPGKLYRAVLVSRGLNSNVFFAIVSWLLLPLSAYMGASHGLQQVDPVVAMAVSAISAYAAWPIVAFNARILLLSVATNSTVVAKCLRDAASLDGVLEIKHAHFWQVGYKEAYGSLHVRVGRDVDPLSVLSRVQAIMAQYTPNMVVQVRQDDWPGPTRAISSGQSAVERTSFAPAFGGHDLGEAGNGHWQPATLV